MDTAPIGSGSVAGAETRAAPPAATAAQAQETPELTHTLPALQRLMTDLQATLLALGGLARSELQLSLALLLRAGLLAAVGLLLLGLSVLLGCALLVATCLALGLSWPAALALSLAVLLLATWACWTRASRHLGQCGLPHTREQLAALWPERAP